MTLTPWRVAYSDSAAGANTITDLVWRRVQTFGHEAFFEPRTVTLPPVFCEPQTPNHVVDPDFGWPYPQGVEPDVDDPLVCRVHDEWWPCSAVRAGRPVTFPPPTVESVLVCRPKETK